MTGTRYASLLGDFEVHSVDGIPLFTSLVEMYLRSPHFSESVRVFTENGLEFDDPALLAMLHFLLRYSADLSVTVRGLLWGRGFEWETDELRPGDHLEDHLDPT